MLGPSIKKIQPFYVTWIFTATVTTARHWTLSWATQPKKKMNLKPVSIWPILVSSCHLRWELVNHLFFQLFRL